MKHFVLAFACARHGRAGEGIGDRGAGLVRLEERAKRLRSPSRRTLSEPLQFLFVWGSRAHLLHPRLRANVLTTSEEESGREPQDARTRFDIARRRSAKAHRPPITSATPARSRLPSCSAGLSHQVNCRLTRARRFLENHSSCIFALAVNAIRAGLRA